MNKEQIVSMREQLAPSCQAREALEKKLAGVPKKRRVSPGKYIAAAACAALLVGAYPVCRTALSRTGQPPLHSYTLLEGDAAQGTVPGVGDRERGEEQFQPAGTPEPAPVPDPAPDQGSAPVEGDRDTMMSPVDLGKMLLRYGVTPEELEGKELFCTWALWWRHVHENGGAITLPGFEAFLEENRAWIDEVRAWEEQHPGQSGGPEMPGGAQAGPSDVQAIPEPTAPDQRQALERLANLIDSFKAEYGPGLYPDWYGGAWLDNRYDDGVSRLVVAVVREYDSKELCLRIQDLARGEVLFTDCRYSLSFLRDLQERVCNEMDRLGLLAGCGVDVENNYVELTLTSVTGEALAILAGLDPEDDAVRVLVGVRPSAETPVSYDVATGKVSVGPPISSRDGGGNASTPAFDPSTVLLPGDPGYVEPEPLPPEPADGLPTFED